MQTLICIDRKLCSIMKLDLAIFYISNMCDLTTDNLDRIFDDELTGCCLDHTGIAALTAAIDKRVRFDAAQTLTVPEQTQARSNIGAVAATDIGDTNTDFVAIFNAALV